MTDPVRTLWMAHQVRVDSVSHSDVAAVAEVDDEPSDMLALMTISITVMVTTGTKNEWRTTFLPMTSVMSNECRTTLLPMMSVMSQVTVMMTSVKSAATNASAE